jgi:hypothetical protein
MSAATDTNVDFLRSRLNETQPDGTKGVRGQAVVREPMLTPKPTPGPDLARNEADERRREEAEQAVNNARHGGARKAVEMPSPQTRQSEEMDNSSKSDFTEDSDEDDSDDKPPTEEQTAAVKEVLGAKSNDYHRILGLKNERSAY